jgi:hypothetical protein
VFERGYGWRSDVREPWRERWALVVMSAYALAVPGTAAGLWRSGDEEMAVMVGAVGVAFGAAFVVQARRRVRARRTAPDLTSEQQPRPSVGVRRRPAERVASDEH